MRDAPEARMARKTLTKIGVRVLREDDGDGNDLSLL
jgi:hypothetical protein